jgi:hypothetical protein
VDADRSCAGPDAHCWAGRRWLAALDAVTWPGVALCLLLQAPEPSGLIKPVLGAFALLAMVMRLGRDVLANHRYRFTTWWAGKWFVVVLGVGLLLKTMLH